MADTLIVRSHSLPLDYLPVWKAMQHFTLNRQQNTFDELWLLEHFPVYTQGLAGKPEHVLHQNETQLVRSDRGGQVTWHGPGQLMIYTLLDTHRLNMGAGALVNLLQTILANVLQAFGVASHIKQDAPGIYVMQQGQEAKIAAVGLRIKKTGCYHGAALNIDCDLKPFNAINPCGYANQAVANLATLLPHTPQRMDIEQQLIHQFTQALHYSRVEHITL